jgi:hypothetical protein
VRPLRRPADAVVQLPRQIRPVSGTPGRPGADQQ